MTTTPRTAERRLACGLLGVAFLFGVSVGLLIGILVPYIV